MTRPRSGAEEHSRYSRPSPAATTRPSPPLKPQVPESVLSADHDWPLVQGSIRPVSVTPFSGLGRSAMLSNFFSVSRSSLGSTEVGALSTNSLNCVVPASATVHFEPEARATNTDDSGAAIVDSAGAGIASV